MVLLAEGDHAPTLGFRRRKTCSTRTPQGLLDNVGGCFGHVCPVAASLDGDTTRAEWGTQETLDRTVVSGRGTRGCSGTGRTAPPSGAGGPS